jgi:hypothetical protein
VSGLARLVADPERVQRYAAEMRAEPLADWRLFEFTVDVAMIVRHTRPTGAVGQRAQPLHQIWRDLRPTLGCKVH